jgi:hypothetical protein
MGRTQTSTRSSFNVSAQKRDGGVVFWRGVGWEGGYLFDVVVEFTELDSVFDGRVGAGVHGRVNGTSL